MLMWVPAAQPRGPCWSTLGVWGAEVTQGVRGRVRFQPSIRRPRALGTYLQGLPGAHAPRGRVLCLLLAEPPGGAPAGPLPLGGLGVALSFLQV